MTTDTARAAEQRRFVAGRQLKTGYEFDTSPNLLATLGPGEPARRSLAQLEAIIAGQPAGTISEAGTIIPPPLAASSPPADEVGTIVGTISERRGRPRKGAEAGTITAMKPWQAEGLSRRTWYRRRKVAADTPERATGAV